MTGSTRGARIEDEDGAVRYPGSRASRCESRLHDFSNEAEAAYLVMEFKMYGRGSGGVDRDCAESVQWTNKAKAAGIDTPIPGKRN